MMVIDVAAGRAGSVCKSITQQAHTAATKAGFLGGGPRDVGNVNGSITTAPVLRRSCGFHLAGGQVPVGGKGGVLSSIGT